MREGQWEKKTKEGKFGTRGTGKRRVLQKNGEVAETNVCRTPVKQEVLTGQRVNEKTLKSKGAVSKATSWCSR